MDNLITPSAPAARPNPIAEGPQPQGYKLPPATIKGWLDGGKVTSSQAHSAAMATDAGYRAGVQRLSDYAKAHNQPFGNDPRFIDRALYGYYKVGSPQKANPSTNALLQALHQQNKPQPIVTPQTQETTPDGFNGAKIAGPIDAAIKDTAGSFFDMGKNALNDLQSGFKGAVDTASDVRNLKDNGLEMSAKNLLPTMGKIGSGFASAISEPVKPIVEGLWKLAISPQKGLLAVNKEDVHQGIAMMGHAISKLQEAHPELARQIEGVLGTLSAPAAMAGMEGGIKTGADVIEGMGKTAADAVSSGEPMVPMPEATVSPETAGQTQDFPQQRIPEHAVQPKLSAADLKKLASTPSGAKALKEGADSTGIISNATGPTLSKGEQGLHELAHTIPGYGQDEGYVTPGKAMSPDAALHNSNVVGTQLVKESEELDSALEKNNFRIPQKESSSAVAKALENAASDAPEETKAYTSAKNIWTRIRSQFEGNATGERAARKEFDSYITDRWGPKVLEKGTPQADAFRTVREASNGLIQKYAKANGLDYQGQLDRLSGMYDLMENLGSHVTPDVMKSTLSRLMEHPAFKAAKKGIGIATGAEAVVHIIP